jgi:endonuclease VIII
MPEGDTIASAAKRIRAAVIDRPIEAVEARHPRFAMDRWDERLAGRDVRSVDTHGKNLFLRFDGGLTIYSHLRMGGWWGVSRRGERWRRSPRRAWLVLRTPEHEVVQFDGPVLELMTDGRSRIDQRIAGLGPDILAPGGFDEQAFLRNLRADDPTRYVGDALLDQRNVAGLGTIWRSEGCFIAGIDPWRRVKDVADEEALAVLAAARPLMQLSVESGGRPVTWRPEVPARGPENRFWVFNREGRPCRRCDTIVRQRGQGDDNRRSFWCPQCQT